MKSENENEKEILRLLSGSNRVSVFDIPSRLMNSVQEMTDRKIIKMKLYQYDMDYKEHLSIYYIEIN